MKIPRVLFANLPGLVFKDRFFSLVFFFLRESLQLLICLQATFSRSSNCKGLYF